MQLSLIVVNSEDSWAHFKCFSGSRLKILHTQRKAIVPFYEESYNRLNYD